MINRAYLFINYLILSAIILLVWINVSFAQTTNGRFILIVTDETNQVVPGANIHIINSGTSQSVAGITNAVGIFNSPLLPVGSYKIEITAEGGFQRFNIENIKLDIGQEYQLSIMLAVSHEVVVVEAGEELIQSTNGEVRSQINSQQVQDLPLDSRDPLQLLKLLPGINSGNFGRLNATGSFGQASITTINGQRTSTATVTQDGINIQESVTRTNSLDFSPNLPTVSQVGEFNVITQNPNVDINGASSVRLITPSGTNRLHGSLFEFHRNRALGANSFFNNLSGIDKPQLLRNQFGATLSGPLTPRLFGNNRLFFFINYEGLRQRQDAEINNRILLPNARQGFFRYRDNQGQFRAVNILALRDITIDPFINSLLNQTPAQANNIVEGDRLNIGGFRFNRPSIAENNQGGLRLDLNTARHHFELIYKNSAVRADRAESDRSFNRQAAIASQVDAQLTVFAWNYLISPSLSNELRVGFNRSDLTINNNRPSIDNFLVNLGDINSPIVAFQDQGRKNGLFTIIDTASYARGKHRLRFGGQIDLIRARTFNFDGTVPTLSLGISNNAPDKFNLKNKDFPGGIDNQQLKNANDILALLGGIIQGGSITFNATAKTSGYQRGAPTISRPQLEQYTAYVSDSWRTKPRLTLNFGLRYDYVTPLREKNDIGLAPVIAPGQSASATLLDPLGRVDFINGFLNNPDRNNFAPNISIAWQLPYFTRATVLRGGYAIVYVNDENIFAGNSGTASNNGLSTTLTAEDLFGTISKNALSITGLMPPPFRIPRSYAENFAIDRASGAFLVDRNFRTPFIQQYNISIERELTNNLTITARYVGNRSDNLARTIDLNQVDVINNGFAADVMRARENGLLAMARTGTFDPAFNPAIPGSQPLLVLSQLPQGGLLTRSQVREFILTGEAGALATFYFQRGLGSNLKLFANPNLLFGHLLTNNAVSNYNGLQLEMRQRLSRGLLVQANYTFSKTLTNTAEFNASRLEPLLDNNQPELENARAPFDVTHSFKANFLYAIPLGRGQRQQFRNRFINGLLSGLQINSIINIQSGAPFSIISGRNTINRNGRSENNTVDSSLTIEQIKELLGFFNTPDGLFYINPNVIGPNGRGAAADGRGPFAGQVFFNPGAGRAGSLARLAFNGPAIFLMDFSLIKRINLTDRTDLEFRGELFNALNHPVFIIADQNINRPNFGKISRTIATPRTIQFGLKLRF